jgi:hypothetical protein
MVSPLPFPFIESIIFINILSSVKLETEAQFVPFLNQALLT